MKNVRDIQTYRPYRTRLSAKDVNDVVTRLEYLERMIGVHPIKIDHINDSPAISLAYTPPSIVIFQLGADLAYHNKAAAKFVEWDVRTSSYKVDDNQKPIEVYDNLGTTCGLESANGWGILRDVNGLIEAIRIAQIARWVRFKLNEDLDTDMSKAQAILLDYWQGYSPEERFGNDFEVHNIPATNTPFIFFGASAGLGGGTSGSSGDVGLACWDEVEKLYKIVQMECSVVA